MKAITAKKSWFHCFKTEFGWVGFCRGNRGLQRLTFGYRNRESARTALHLWAKPLGVDLFCDKNADDDLVQRVIDFSRGHPDMFLDVEVEFPKMTEFQKSVTDTCRSIPYGKTLSYGELATACGSPGAARAVGNVMRKNSVTLIIPCHRVVGSNGNLGGFSAPQGINMKQRLLDMEAKHMYVDV
jgi:methylated-DNA-[protein]-cysteine S-methyltransferase